MVILPVRRMYDKSENVNLYKPAFGLCRLFKVMQGTQKFNRSFMTRDLAFKYAIDSNYDISDIDRDFMYELGDYICAYYLNKHNARLKSVKDEIINSDKVKLVPKLCVDTMSDIINSHNVNDINNHIDTLAIRTLAVAHYLDDADVPDSQEINNNFIAKLLDKTYTYKSKMKLYEALVRLTMLPPHLRGLDYAQNASILESAPREYASNDVPRFHDKKYDEPTPGVSRSCTRDPYTLFITDRDSASIVYGRPVSTNDHYYRILCDMFYTPKKEK